MPEVWPGTIELGGKELTVVKKWSLPGRKSPARKSFCSTGDVRRTYFHPAVSWRIENLYRHVNGKFLLVTLVCKELQKTLVSYTHIVWLQFSCELHGL